VKWNIEYIKKEDYLSIRTEGFFKIPSLIEMFENILSNIYWRPGMKYFFDHRLLDFSKSPYHDIEEAGNIQTEYANKFGGGKAALLMRSEIHYGKAKQFELLVQERIAIDIAIFLNEDDALEWLLE